MKPATSTDVRDWCMARLGYGPELFVAHNRGRNNEISRKRRALWWLMRHTPRADGMIPSYPEIAILTGMATHSVIIAGVKLMDKEMAAAISSGIVPVVERPLPMNRKGAAKMKGKR